MDPELKAYLDDMRDEIKATEQRAIARDAETRHQMDARFAEAAARDAETRQQMAAGDAETRKMMDARFAEAAARDAETHKTVDGLRDEVAEVHKTMDARFAEAAAHDAGTRKTMDARFAETQQQMEAKIDEVRRQAGMDRDAIIREIKALPEAFSTFQRQEADRLDAAREEDMLNRHVLPLEASAANHERRLRAVEKP